MNKDFTHKNPVSSSAEVVVLLKYLSLDPTSEETKNVLATLVLLEEQLSFLLESFVISEEQGLQEEMHMHNMSDLSTKMKKVSPSIVDY